MAMLGSNLVPPGSVTYKQMTLKMMSSNLKVNMFAMPKAKHRIMLRTPSLDESRALVSNLSQTRCFLQLCALQHDS